MLFFFLHILVCFVMFLNIFYWPKKEKLWKLIDFPFKNKIKKQRRGNGGIGGVQQNTHTQNFLGAAVCLQRGGVETGGSIIHKCKCRKKCFITGILYCVGKF